MITKNIWVRFVVLNTAVDSTPPTWTRICQLSSDCCKFVQGPCLLSSKWKAMKTKSTARLNVLFLRKTVPSINVSTVLRAFHFGHYGAGLLNVYPENQSGQNTGVLNSCQHLHGDYYWAVLPAFTNNTGEFSLYLKDVILTMSCLRVEGTMVLKFCQAWSSKMVFLVH